MTACATRIWNEPIQASDPDNDYLFTNRAPKQNDQKTLVVLTFSGGGMRAAAFAYGILEKLSQTMVNIDGVERPLLQEVDVISSVSGGSFTAAYYGLFGEQIFTDFEQKFLKKNIQQKLWRLLLNPANLTRISRQNFNRSDLTAQWLDGHVFGRRTFYDMSLGELPYVIINASDLNNGMSFAFVQPQFDLLCSNMNNYPVANAVMASSAIPYLFSVISLRNYDSGCSQRHYQWIDDALLSTDHYSRNYLVARSLAGYFPPAPVPVIRLVDGGVTDNLGIRGSIMNPIIHYGNVSEMSGGGDIIRQANRILVIVANAQARSDNPWSRRGTEPRILQRLSASFSAAVSLLNTETVSEAQEDFMNLTRNINTQRQPGQPPVSTYFVKLIFDEIENPQDHTYFNAIPTSFALTDEEVDRIKELAHRLLDQSGDFRSFLSSLDNVP